MKLTQEQVKRIREDKGASLDFKTGKPTTKKGYIVSLKDTESQILNASAYTLEELTQRINQILTSNTYNEDANAKNILGLWINEEDVLFVDVSKCINVNSKNLYIVKNEALINNQYAVYNNITNKTYNLILPIYMLYNTRDLIGRIGAGSINNYAVDFYKYDDIKEALNLTSNGSLQDIIFESVDAIPDGYNYSKVIIKDLSNYTRDILEQDAGLTYDEARKLSQLIEA